MNTPEQVEALDAIAVKALAKVNKIDKHAKWLLNAIFTLLLVATVTFSVLGYVRMTNLIAAQNKRASDNHDLLTTIQADDKILKTATGPGTIAASTKQIHCVINRLDADTSKDTPHPIALDPTCPKF